MPGDRAMMRAMSLFDGTAHFNPLPWLQEKTLKALEDAARLVDLANEPDTTPWYAKTLKERATALIVRLAPVVVYVHGAGKEAANQEEWQGIARGGSFALGAWCKRWDIANPAAVALGALAEEREEAEADEKALTAEQPIAEASPGGGRRLSIYGAVTGTLIHADLSEPARRLMLWVLSRLWLSEHDDTAVVSRRFLPGDIGCSAEDTAAAYRMLSERRMLERVDGLKGVGPDSLALRVIVEGLNESKHPAEFREETFGFPGQFIDGKPTIANILTVPLPEHLGAALARWFGRATDDETGALAKHLQAVLDAGRALVEKVELRGGTDTPFLSVRLRQLMGDSDEDLRRVLVHAAEAWLRTRVVT